MANVNKVILIGTLTRDPELRVTPKGTAICQFGLAVNRTWKDESGQAREDVTFIDCEAWAKGGETIAKYVRKGRQIFIEGRLQLDQWEDKATGQKRSKLKVVVETFQFIGKKDDQPAAAAPDGGDPGYSQRPETPPPRSPAPGGGRPAPAPQHDINDEDVPF